MERTYMKMKLHTMSRLGFVLTFVLFGVAFIVSVIIGALGPNVFITTSGEPTSIAGNWTGTISNLTKLHQQLILTMKIQNKNYMQNGYSQKVDFWITIEGRDASTANSQAPASTTSSVTPGTPLPENSWNTIQSQTIHTQQLDCAQGRQMCKDFIVSREPFVHYNEYRYSIGIIGINNPSGPLSFIGNTTFVFSYINDSFTVFELWFRFTFLVLTFGVIAYFFLKLKYILWNDWSIEQKWIAVLLFALLAYNNPLFPVTILVDGWVAPFLDIVLLVSFLCLLLFFWLSLFDGMRVDAVNRNFWKFYLPKIFLVGTLWVLIVTAFTIVEVLEVQDSAAVITSQPYYLGFQITIGILLSLYLIALGFSVYGSLNAINQMPFLAVRLKFFGVLTFVVFIVMAVGVVFGLVGPVQNNAAEFLSFLSLFNFYVYTLAFVYLPSGISSASSSSDFEKRIGVARLDDNDEDGDDILLSIRKGGSAASGGRKSSAIGMIGDESEEGSVGGGRGRAGTFTDLDAEKGLSETSSEAL